MQYTEETAKLCANNGARLLDEYDPEWYEHIDLNDFNIRSQCHCVIGQLYVMERRLSLSGAVVPLINSPYEDALTGRTLDPRWRTAMRSLLAEHPTLAADLDDSMLCDKFLGFDIYYDVEATELEHLNAICEQRFSWLQVAWLREIEQRWGAEWKTTTTAAVPSS